MDSNDRNAPRVAANEPDSAQTKRMLAWNRNKVRVLQAELDARKLASLKPLHCPQKLVGGPCTLKGAGQALELDIQSYLNEADLLSLVSRGCTNQVLFRSTRSWRPWPRRSGIPKPTGAAWPSTTTGWPT